MKKLITSLVSLVLLIAALPAVAQNHSTASFLTPGISMVTSTNTIGITNLNYILSTGTNRVGLIYTNQGTRVIAAAGDYKNLFVDVPLWTDALARPFTTNNTAPATSWAPANLCIKTTSSSGANAAITFIFAPVLNDSTGEVTGTASQFTASITVTASSTETFFVPFPMYNWPGAKKVRLLYVLNADTDAASDVKITHISLNGFKP